MTRAIDDPRPAPEWTDADRHLVETRISGERVFEGALLDVRRDRIRLPDGNEAVREYIVHPGAVLIVPVLDDGLLVVERQFRYPPNRVFLEFPAGKLDPGEEPLATAQRELIEEAGYAAARFTRLGEIYSVVSYTTEVITIYLGEGLNDVGRKLDHGEHLDIVTMPVDAMFAALDRGEITDAKTVAALCLFDRRRRGITE